MMGIDGECRGIDIKYRIDLLYLLDFESTV
jgi:hypothetical protein